MIITIILSSLLFFSFILNCIGIFGLYVCYKKINIYEDWVRRFSDEINSIYSKLKLVDDMNLFEKDDHVGFVFSEILRVMKEFNEEIQ
jgi:hypothetical protein